MLSNGFTVRDVKGGVRYHPAIEAVILLNEPELKISYQGQIAGQAWSQGRLDGFFDMFSYVFHMFFIDLTRFYQPRYYMKALLSALDGALSAEQQLQVAGRKPPFTVETRNGESDLSKPRRA